MEELLGRTDRARTRLVEGFSPDIALAWRPAVGRISVYGNPTS
jgi:hypothetical protein